MSDDGWTLAPSGWRYRKGNARPVAQDRGDGQWWGYELDDLAIPPCDHELVRSLWEAKDG